MQEPPKQLVDRVRGLPDEWKQAKYAAAAYEVVTYYTGLQLHESMFAPFPLHGGAPSEMRLVWLGASLFILKEEAILPELLRRLRERDLRSTYFEISAAGFCKELGYALIPSPGIKQRGMDFDFSIVIEPLFLVGPFSQREVVNVEVTELQSGNFDVQRIVNSLNHKRKQLPSDYPGMLICHYPFEWENKNTNISRYLDKAVEIFFRGTEKINVLVFSRETYEMTQDKYSVHYVVFINNRARKKAERLSIAAVNRFHHIPRSLENATDTPRKPDARFRLNIFERWVDSVLGS